MNRPSHEPTPFRLGRSKNFTWTRSRPPIGDFKPTPALGTDPILLGLLDAAMDADHILGATLVASDDAQRHPLADWVQTRDTAHMIAWALNGTPPPVLDKAVQALSLTGFDRSLLTVYVTGGLQGSAQINVSRWLKATWQKYGPRR
ncbi:hypothetical protein ACIBLA_37065 [Streptomyces sp. NPDC050433]|uniref:hypothetical protein n=1 Tax=unclassified Streptomyces TaxID=2593676 RepID=UPI003424870E